MLRFQCLQGRHESVERVSVVEREVCKVKIARMVTSSCSVSNLSWRRTRPLEFACKASDSACMRRIGMEDVLYAFAEKAMKPSYWSLSRKWSTLRDGVKMQGSQMEPAIIIQGPRPSPGFTKSAVSGSCAAKHLDDVGPQKRHSSQRREQMLDPKHAVWQSSNIANALSKQGYN